MLNPPQRPSETEPVADSLLNRRFNYRARPVALLVAAAAVAAPPIVLGGAARAEAGGRHGSSGGQGSSGSQGSSGGQGSSAGHGTSVLSVASGETYTVTATTAYDRVVIADGGALAAPDGYSLTLTVNGVEVGSALPSLYDDDGIVTYIAPGTYSGKVVITVAEQNVIAYLSSSWPIRQALYVDADGVDTARSVLAATSCGGQIGASRATDLSLRSDSEAFNGVYVAGGASYTLTRPTIALTGNGRSDFIGYGAGIVGTGAGTTLVVDGAKIHNKGVVRDAVVIDDGAVAVIKNSTIVVEDGTPPAEYVNTGDQTFMMTCPWLLGLYGTVRATNLLGVNTRATYLNTSITNDRWALWSIDSGAYGDKNLALVVINSTGKHVGDEGYGSYAIGYPTEYFLGTSLDVGTYVAIIWGATGMYYGDSSSSKVQGLNADLGLGLTSADIASVTSRKSVLRSRKFGFMWHSTGPVHIDGGTTLHTAQTTFLSKGVGSSVIVDGSDGATVKTANGVIYQIIDNDNPGKVTVTDKPWSAEYTKPYVQVTGPATKSASFDPTVAHSTDASGQFSHIRLEGDFYNGLLGGGVNSVQGLNLVLTFTDATVKGVISASLALHNESPIDFDTYHNYKQLGVVTNTAQAVVNNGVIVTLEAGSTWVVTGTSYLSSLTVSADSTVTTAHGGTPTLTVDGTATALTPGSTYTGAITITA